VSGVHEAEHRRVPDEARVGLEGPSDGAGAMKLSDLGVDVEAFAESGSMTDSELVSEPNGYRLVSELDRGLIACFQESAMSAT